MPATLTTVPKLFVGAWLPKKVQAVVADYPRPAVGDLRWSTPSQWLVSLRPLGDVLAATVPAVADALRFELDGAPRVTVAFGPVYRDGWLMVPVLGLEELVEVVFDATIEQVPATHRTTWLAHVVLARGRATKELEQPISARWTVDELVLAKATRTKEGPGYDDIETFRLGGA
jgi:2'-5' RNA ligase